MRHKGESRTLFFHKSLTPAKVCISYYLLHKLQAASFRCLLLVRESDASKREGVGPTFFWPFVNVTHSTCFCLARVVPLVPHQHFDASVPFLLHALPGVLLLNLDWDHFRGDW